MMANRADPSHSKPLLCRICSFSIRFRTVRISATSCSDREIVSSCFSRLSLVSDQREITAEEKGELKKRRGKKSVTNRFRHSVSCAIPARLCSAVSLPLSLDSCDGCAAEFRKESGRFYCTCSFLSFSFLLASSSCPCCPDGSGVLLSFFLSFFSCTQSIPLSCVSAS